MSRDPIYRTAAWRHVRTQVLQRDRGLCQIRAEGCQTIATHVDHIQPISTPEGRARAYDPTNLRAVCGSCNTRRANARRTNRIAGDDTAWKHGGIHITLLWAPPGTDLHPHLDHTQHDDLIVDYDRIAHAIGWHTTPDGAMNPAAVLRATLIRLIAQGKVTGPTRAWITSASPDAPATIPHHQLTVIDPGQAHAIAHTPPHLQHLVAAWYRAAAEHHTTPSRAWGRA